MRAMTGIDRAPPHSIEAEQSVLGGILLDASARDKIADLIGEPDFYRFEHRLIFRHIGRLTKQAQPVDVITVAESLENNAELDKAGGLAYLGSLAQNVPFAANIRRYAEIVSEHAARRSLIGLANEIQSSCTAAGADTAQIIRQTRAALDRVKPPTRGFNLLYGADLCNTPTMRWLVLGVLPAEGIAGLYGASGSGKSFLTLGLACAVAAGAKWFGRRVTQCFVTYVCLEGEAGMRKRVKAWSLHHNKPIPDAMRFIMQPFNLLSDDVSELAKAIIAAGGAGGMVILDTLNRAAPGADENSSVDMGSLIAAAKELQTLLGGLVLLVHHTGKDSTKGLRGHSSLYAALDGAIEVTATDSRRVWSVAKSKDDLTGDAYPFKLEIVQVGHDEDGETITSCVIVPDESGEVIQRKRHSLGKNQKIAKDVLGEPLRKSTHTGKDGAPIGRPCIDYAEAVELVAERMPTDAKHRNESAKRAIGSLVASGYLGMKGDWLWDI